MTQQIRMREVTSENTPNEIHRNEINLEKRLQDWLEADISMLDPDLLVIGREVPTAFGGKIDLLCLDSSGGLVVVELKKGKMNRPGFTGERLVQILGCFFMCVQGFIEHLLCFVRRDISDGAVKTLGVVPIDPFQRFPFKLAH